jgi:hypothetical protein
MLRTAIPALLLILTIGGGAAAASEADIALFGADPGDQPAHACFIRHYDQAHLKVHPEQNVTDMVMFVNSTVDPSYGRGYDLSLGVNFRDVEHQMQVSGGCSSIESEDGSEPALLGCGIECDGGSISVNYSETKGSLRIEIPYGARTWDPLSVDEETPAAAEFGPDDKEFRLDPTELSECLPLIYDEALKTEIVAGKAE